MVFFSISWWLPEFFPNLYYVFLLNSNKIVLEFKKKSHQKEETVGNKHPREMLSLTGTPGNEQETSPSRTSPATHSPTNRGLQEGGQLRE